MPTVRLYVGNLPKDRAVERSELEEHFEKFGKVVDIWVARQPPGFAFVTMEDEKEAQEAVKELDGGKVAGERIRVEVSKGGESKKNNAPRKDSRSRSRRGGRGRRRRRSPSYSDSYSDSRSSGLSGAQLKRLDELNKIWQEILAERRSQKALAAIANGEGPHFVGNAPQKNQLGAPAKVAGQHFSVPEELDPANASILHMAHPRSREVAMLMAEHARWAQRDALKALFLAASDSNQAFEAARRANEAVMQAMRQPNASFPVYAEKPLPLEPWLATEKWPTDPPDPLRTMPLGNPPPGVHLERLAQWFQLHPRPLMAKPVDHIDVKPPDTSKGTNAEAWSTVNAASAGLQAPSMPHRAPAPVPFLSGRDPYMSKPPPPPGPDDDPDPLPDQKTPPSPGIAPPKGGLPPPLEPPASQLCVSDGILMSSSLLERALSTRRRRRQRRDEMTKFFCSTSTVAVF